MECVMFSMASDSGVGEVVHGVDAPRVPPAVMGRVADAIEEGSRIFMFRAAHVDLRAKHVGPVRELAGAHACEEVEVLLHGAFAPGALPARLGRWSPDAAGSPPRSGCPRTPSRPGSAGLRAGRAARSSPTRRRACPSSRNRATARPAGSSPTYFMSSVSGFRVVHPHVADAAELLRDSEVQADGLGVAYVKVAVRLGGKAGDHPAAVDACEGVAPDDFPQEICGSLASGPFGWLEARYFITRKGPRVKKSGRRTVDGSACCVQK